MVNFLSEVNFLSKVVGFFSELLCFLSTFIFLLFELVGFVAAIGSVFCVSVGSLQWVVCVARGFGR